MKNIKKGTYGYIKNQKLKKILIAFVLFLIPMIIYVSGYIYHGTKENILTVVAIVGCLPACKAMVSVIMIWMQKSMDAGLYEQAKAAAGDLTAGYELVFTSYEHTTPVNALIVCGNEIICYTPDAKCDTAFLEKHITKIMAANGYHEIHAKVMKEFKQYLQRVETIRDNQERYREGLTFQPDERYPGLSRDEVIYHTLLAISL